MNDDSMVSSAQAPHAGQHSLAIVLAYSNVIAAVELVGLLAGALAPLVGHTILLPLLLGHYALAARSASQRMLAALALVPLLRLLSLIMPTQAVPPLYWYVLIGVPLLVASVMVMRLLDMRRGDVGMGRWRWSQLIVAISGVPLGIAASVLLRPSPLLQRFSWPAVIAGALILTVFVGFAQELIFRGIIQRVAGEQSKRLGILLGSLLSAVVHLSSFSPGYVLFIAIVGLFFGWCVYRTGAIWGTTLAHSAMQIALFLPMPYLEVAPPTIVRTSIISVAIALLAVALIVGLLEIRSKALARPALVPSPAPAETHLSKDLDIKSEAEARAD